MVYAIFKNIVCVCMCVGKTFVRAPQMNMNMATWGRLRRAIPSISNSFSPQSSTEHGTEPGRRGHTLTHSPTRYTHTHTLRCTWSTYMYIHILLLCSHTQAGGGILCVWCWRYHWEIINECVDEISAVTLRWASWTWIKTPHPAPSVTHWAESEKHYRTRRSTKSKCRWY